MKKSSCTKNVSEYLFFFSFSWQKLQNSMLTKGLVQGYRGNGGVACEV